MANLIRVRALQRRPLRLDGNIISTSGDGTVIDLDHGRSSQDFRIFSSYPFGKSRFVATGEDTAGSDLGGHNFPPNKAVTELTLTDGQVLYSSFELGRGETIATATLYSGATALNAGLVQAVGLYQLNALGTILTLLTSVDDVAVAWAASTAKTFNFADVVTTGAGTYALGILLHATTAIPTLVGRSPFNSVVANSNTDKTYGTIGSGLVALPATITLASAANSNLVPFFTLG